MAQKSQSHDFDFFGILKKVKVMTLTWLDLVTCRASLVIARGTILLRFLKLWIASLLKFARLKLGSPLTKDCSLLTMSLFDTFSCFIFRSSITHSYNGCSYWPKFLVAFFYFYAQTFCLCWWSSADWSIVKCFGGDIW